MRASCCEGSRTEQKYLQGFREHFGFLMDLRLDVRTALQTEGTYYDPDLSLQVCHCGWNKVTTYRGLRIHQGKKGCTPKGVRIPREEQTYWKNYWEQEVAPKAERAVIQPENFPPRMGRSINSAAAAAAIKEEHKSLPPHSSIQPGHQLEERSARPQVNGPVRGNPSAVRAKKTIKSQTLPQNTNKGGIQDYHTDDSDKYSTTAAYATPKVSTKRNSLKSKDELLDFSSSMQKRLQDRNHQVTSSVLPRQRDGRDQTSSRVNTWVKELPESNLEPAVRPKEKHLEARRAKQLVREQPSAPPVVPVKKEDSPVLTERQEGNKSQLLQENLNFIEKGNKTRKGKRGDIKPTEPIYQNVVELQRQSLSSVKRAAPMEEKTSPFQTPPDSLKEPTNTNPAAAEQMSVRKILETPPVVPPKKNPLWSTLKPENSEGSSATATQDKEKLEQKVVLSQSIDSPEAAAFVEENQSPVKTPKESLKIPTNSKAAAGQVNGKPLVPPKKKNPPSLPAEPKKSESATETENQTYLQEENIKREEEIHDVKPEKVADVTSTNNQTEAAEIPSDDPTSESTEQPDITAGRTVKDLAKLFSVITNQPTEELKPSQVKRVAQWLSAIKTQEPAVQPEKEKLKLMQSATDTPVPHKASAATEVQQREAPASLFEAAESEFSTGMKVRELARRFSLQESAQLKEKNHREEHKPSQLRKQVANQRRWIWEELKVTQKSSDSTGAATKSGPEAHEASQMSGVSSGLKVKDLVRRFSAG